MSKVKGWRCPNCGQMLPVGGRIMKCQFCGTEFEKSDDYEQFGIGKVLWLPMGTSEICRYVKIPAYYFRDEKDQKGAVMYGFQKMCEEFADELMKYVEFEVTQDHMHDHILMRGRVKVVRPEKHNIHNMFAMMQDAEEIQAHFEREDRR